MIVTPQVRHPERSEGSQAVQNRSYINGILHYAQDDASSLCTMRKQTYPQPGELKIIINAAL